jgi:alpha-D-ribose 1-methylphosphonate 5-phosphate C-P lyase
VPPYTPVHSLDFEDHPFEVQRWEQCLRAVRRRDSFLDEVIVDDAGKRCSSARTATIARAQPGRASAGCRRSSHDAVPVSRGHRHE